MGSSKANSSIGKPRGSQVTLREADRAARHAQTTLLEQICKESLDADRQRALEQRRANRKQRKPEASNRSNNARTISDHPSPEGAAAGVTSSSIPDQGGPPHAGGARAQAMDATPAGAAAAAPAPRLGRRGSDDMYPREKGVFAPPSRGRTDLSAHSSLASGPLHHIHGGPAPGTPLYEEDDDYYDNGILTSWSREHTGVSSDASSGLLPWHHQQLYRLYGKAAADEFLYPKFEDKKRTVAPKAINPRLRRQGVNAGELWDELRNDSRMKLLKEDSTIAPELKYAYSAFVRQVLQRRKMPVKRNYYEKEDEYRVVVLNRFPGWKDESLDVPDLELLMDQSRIRDAQDYKHKCEIMYRSSHMNEDRTRVLLYNNPPPNLNDWAGEQSGPDRYMPSWAPETESDVSSELSYKKWLRPLQEVEEEAPLQLQETLEQPPAGRQKDLQHDDDTGFFVTRPRPRPRASHAIPRLAFLTEAGARCDGQFSTRHREAQDVKGVPPAYTDARPDHEAPDRRAAPGVVSHSAMGRIGGASPYRISTVPGSVNGRKSGLRRSQSEMCTGEYRTAWQPLSLGALIEYKPRIPALGRGDFSLGKAPIWKTGTAPA